MISHLHFSSHNYHSLYPPKWKSLHVNGLLFVISHLTGAPVNLVFMWLSLGYRHCMHLIVMYLHSRAAQLWTIKPLTCYYVRRAMMRARPSETLLLAGRSEGSKRLWSVWSGKDGGDGWKVVGSEAWRSHSMAAFAKCVCVNEHGRENRAALFNQQTGELRAKA